MTRNKKSKGKQSENQESDPLDNSEALPENPNADTGNLDSGSRKPSEDAQSDIFAQIDNTEHQQWDDFDGAKEQENPAAPRGFAARKRTGGFWGPRKDNNNASNEHPDPRRDSSNPFIEPLKEISGPIVITDKRSERFKVAEVHFTACEPLTSSGGSTNAQFASKRVEDAIRLGEHYLARDPPPYETRRLTRSEARSEIFKDTLDAVNELLTHVIRYSSDKGPNAYSIQRSLLVRVKRKLAVWMELAKADVIDQGLETIPIPVFGVSGRGDEFWDANDFEILGACYRKEVEEYLATIIDVMALAEEVREERRRESEEIAAGVQEMQHKVQEYFISKGIARKEEKRSVDFQETPKSPPKAVKQESLSANVYAYSARTSNLNPSVFSQPNRLTASRKMQELFGGEYPIGQESSASRAPPISPRNPFRPSAELTNQRRQDDRRRSQPPHMSSRNAGTPGGDSSGGDSSSDDGGNNRNSRDPRKPHTRRGNGGNDKSQHPGGATNVGSRSNEVHFENKLKLDVIPVWDGKLDDLVRWLAKVNHLSERSQTAYEQLGALVPSKLTGSAETWYFSLPLSKRNHCEENWGNLRETIAGYYMNRSFMESQKIKANRTKFRDSTHPHESPSEYFIRKLELLQLVYDYSDSEVITEIMKGAPTSWVSIVTPHLYDDITEFQTVIRFHEETLVKLEPQRSFAYRRDEERYQRDAPNRDRNRTNDYRNARINLVGSSDKLPPPQWPKDDNNVSKRQTPESKGFRPCRHCGSGKHWDYECRYSRKSQRSARANKASIIEDDPEAQEEYDNGYYNLLSDDEAQGDF